MSTVLIVDDEPTVSELLSEGLAREGYSCRISSSGEEALHLMQQETFDAVISDLRMPGMGGLNAMRAIRAIAPKAKVIVVSQFTLYGDCRKGRRPSFSDAMESRSARPLFDTFVEKDWNWMITEVAKRIKATRDATFQKTNSKGITVNRTPAIAFLGGAAHNNEECYLASKLNRALGVVYLEHQARI
jgi:CheY-like chemotaxis protein